MCIRDRNYFIFAKYYKLADSIWIYILPGITGGAWNTMVFRTFFEGCLLYTSRCV